jgi:hypothetical protein
MSTVCVANRFPGGIWMVLRKKEMTQEPVPAGSCEVPIWRQIPGSKKLLAGPAQSFPFGAEVRAVRGWGFKLNLHR